MDKCVDHLCQSPARVTANLALFRYRYASILEKFSYELEKFKGESFHDMTFFFDYF